MHPSPPPSAPLLTSYFWSGDTLRSRSVGNRVLTGQLNLPAAPARLIADCEREALRLGLEPGDVEPLSLARARTRWPDYRLCLQAMADWAQSLGLHDALAASTPALMACRGAKYHHDGAHYGGEAFCNLFLSEDKGLDVHFPMTGQRLPLTRGTAMVFDTGQPHAVIPRQSSRFEAADFAAAQDCSQFFLSWELGVEDMAVARALGLVFDVDPLNSARLDAEQVWLQGAPAALCPHTGQWQRHA
jgi:hypothetical protein